MSFSQNIRKWFSDYSIGISWSIILALLIINSILTYVNFQSVVVSTEEVRVINDRLILTQQLLIALDDAETGQRGFIITGKNEYLEPFVNAQKRFDGILKQLREMSRSEDDAIQEIEKLEELIRLKMKEMKVVLELRRWQGMEAASKRILENHGKLYMDDFRELVHQSEVRQRDQLARQRDHVKHSRSRALAMLIAGSILMVGMAFTVFFIINRQLKFRIHMENQLREANTDLEKRVAHRTEALVAINQSLHDEILERKRLEAESAAFAEGLRRSNRELEQFASVASHDLQEPLRKIQAFSDRLTTRYKDKLDEAGQNYIERIQFSAGRMRHLIEDLLTYSRVGTKGKPFVPVDLNVIVKEVAGELEVRLQETNAKLTIGSLPTVEADETQMRQLFQNLIGNSLKFSRPGVQPELILSSKEQMVKGKPGCEITLQDNGIGFEQQYADRIFQLFQRLHGRNEYEGTGMGLAICQKIVERHQGSIVANGVVDVGASFVIRLPLFQQTNQES
jgi:signal transduction histidine kinase